MQAADAWCHDAYQKQLPRVVQYLLLCISPILINVKEYLIISF